MDIGYVKNSIFMPVSSLNIEESGSEKTSQDAKRTVFWSADPSIKNSYLGENYLCNLDIKAGDTLSILVETINAQGISPLIRSYIINSKWIDTANCKYTGRFS